jgi:uncharacterized protein (UPF0332 family)
VLRLVDDFSQRLREHFGVALRDVQLTGAYARGIATPRSEIQVIVLLDRAGFSEQHDVLNVVGDLLAETGLLIGVQIFDPLSYRSHLAPRASTHPPESSRDASRLAADRRRQASASELAVAREELEASQHLIAQDQRRVAVSRLYFAVFRAARAMLYTQGFEPASHSKVLTVFSASLVRPGHCDRACTRVLTRLHAFRMIADDGEPFAISEEEMARELREAYAFVAMAEELTQARG